MGCTKKEKEISFTRDGVNGSDFVGVFLGEFETFSKKEKQVLSHKGDGSPRCRLFLLPVVAWDGFGEFMGVTEVTLPRPNGGQFLSWPVMVVGVLTA